MSRFEIESDGYTYKRIELDGHDVSKSVRSVTIACEPGERPTVTLDVVAEATQFGADGPATYVLLPDDARDLLIRQGWTPPAESASA